MLQTIWFFIKISLIITALVWVSFQTGSVSIEAMNYNIQTEFGIFLLGLIAAFFIVYFIFWLVRIIFSAPKNIIDYQEKTKQQRGYQALTKGLVAVAAGDSKKATKFSKQTCNLMKEQTGLPVLLEAQAARLRGDEETAYRCFAALSKSKDTAFLGVRGLLKSSLDQGDYVQALGFVQQARSLCPNQDWVVKIAYELEIRNRLWDHALQTLKKAVAIGAVSTEQAKSDRIAIYIECADRAQDRGEDLSSISFLKKAYRLDNIFIPTVTRMIEYYMRKSNDSKAVSIILKTWKENPHSDLAQFWKELAPALTEKNHKKYLHWYERFLNVSPDNIDGLMMMAHAAVDIEKWDQATVYLDKAEEIKPTSDLFKLREVIQKNTLNISDKKQNLSSVNQMVESMANTFPEKCWVCSQTGNIYGRWTAIAQPHGLFNTIIWDYPMARHFSNENSLDNRIYSYQKENFLIDPVA